MQRFWAIGLAVLMGLAGCGQSSRSGEAGEPLGKELNPAIAAVYPALVRIWVVMALPQEGRMQKFQAAGSGAIISADGYVVTNHHVAGDATDIRCDLPDGERIEADLVGTDPLADIAVIKLRLNSRRDPKKPLSVAHFGDSNQVRVGDTVFAMGSPAALSQSVTKGIVSNTRMILPVILPEEMHQVLM